MITVFLRLNSEYYLAREEGDLRPLAIRLAECLEYSQILLFNPGTIAIVIMNDSEFDDSNAILKYNPDDRAPISKQEHRIGLQFKFNLPDDEGLGRAGANYLRNFVQYFLIQYGFAKIFTVIETVTSSIEENRPLLNPEYFYKEKTSNAKMLDEYEIPDDNVPDELKCILSKQVLDNPVYIAVDVGEDGPTAFYDRSKLLHWLFQQEALQSPFTRNPMSYEDIVPSDTKRKEVNDFLHKPIFKKLENRNRYKELQGKYKLKDNSDAEINKGLRRAAADNKTEDMNFFIEVMKADVDAVDENPNKHKTALHWAAERGAVDCVMALITAEARLNIQDALDRTPLHWAVINNHVDCVRQLLGTGARHDIADSEGKTVMDYVGENEEISALMLFEEMPKLSF